MFPMSVSYSLALWGGRDIKTEADYHLIRSLSGPELMSLACKCRRVTVCSYEMQTSYRIFVWNADELPYVRMKCRRVTVCSYEMQTSYRMFVWNADELPYVRMKCRRVTVCSYEISSKFCPMIPNMFSSFWFNQIDLPQFVGNHWCYILIYQALSERTSHRASDYTFIGGVNKISVP